MQNYHEDVDGDHKPVCRILRRVVDPERNHPTCKLKRCCHQIFPHTKLPDCNDDGACGDDADEIYPAMPNRLVAGRHACSLDLNQILTKKIFALEAGVIAFLARSPTANCLRAHWWTLTSLSSLCHDNFDHARDIVTRGPGSTKSANKRKPPCTRCPI